MDTILTLQGVYHIFYAENGALTEDAHDCFRDAASLGAPFLYADEETHLPNGRKKLVHKPGWSPDTLRSCNYIGSPFAVSRALCETVGWPAENTAAERYALLLRVMEHISFGKHIARVLYRGAAEKPCTDLLVLRKAMRRQHDGAEVLPGHVEGSFCVRYPIPDGTRVSVIVIAGEEIDAVRATLESVVCRATYPEMELIVCDGGSMTERREAYYSAIQSFGAGKVVRLYCEPNVPGVANRAAEEALGDVLLFLPAGIELARHDTVERMLEYALLEHVSAVGGVIDRQGMATSGIIHNAARFDGPMMTRAAYFASQSGFDTTFERTGYIRAFTQLSADMGFYNVITPYAAFMQSSLCRHAPATEKNRLRMQDMQFAHRHEQTNSAVDGQTDGEHEAGKQETGRN